MKELKLLISEDAYSLLVTSLKLTRMADTDHGAAFDIACAIVESIERGDPERTIQTRRERTKTTQCVEKVTNSNPNDSERRQ